MGPEGFASKRRKGILGISNEAAGCVSVHSQQERDEEVMCVPECLERLLAYAVVCRGIHEEHTQQHDMASDATRLRIVDLHGGFRPNLGPLDIEEIDVMCTDVSNGENQERVSALAVEPLRLVQGKESEFRTNEPQQIPAHW
jgi:hypothetical protein